MVAEIHTIKVIYYHILVWFYRSYKKYLFDPFSYNQSINYYIKLLIFYSNYYFLLVDLSLFFFLSHIIQIVVNVFKISDND